MRRLDAHLRAAVFDHLDFHEVLAATVTDRAARAALAYMQEVNSIKASALSCVAIVSRLTRCRTLDLVATEPRDFVHLTWPLTFMKALESLSISSGDGFDVTTWEAECDRFVRTGALRQAKSLTWFEINRHTTDHGGEQTALDATYLESGAFQRLLHQLPLDCALMTAVFGCVPAACVSELLARGANPNHTEALGSYDPIRLSVLERACEYQRPDVIRMLLDAGATLTVVDRSGGPGVTPPPV